VQRRCLTIALIFGENPQLRIGRRAFQNDGAAVFEILAAAKRLTAAGPRPRDFRIWNRRGSSSTRRFSCTVAQR
jgi:hypothetical protein